MTEPNRQSGENEERIIEIEIERLRPFKEHPFQVKDDSDSEMNDNKSNHIISVDEKRYDSDNRSEDYQAYENLVKENIDYELLLRHAARFSCPLKGKTDPVKVKFAFVPFNFHSITI